MIISLIIPFLEINAILKYTQQQKNLVVGNIMIIKSIFLFEKINQIANYFFYSFDKNVEL